VKVAYYSADEPEFACARLRVLGPLELLAPQVEVACGVAMAVHHAGTPDKRVTYTVDTRLAVDADLLVVQRSFPRPDSELTLAELLSTGKPVIYETDDDLRIIPDWRREYHYQQYIPYIEGMVRRADLVTVSTAYLAERYSPLNRSTVVLPNRLPHSIWRSATHFRKRSGRLTIGYCGTRTHDQDLKLIEEALIDVSRRHPGVDFVFMGCVTRRLRRLRNARVVEYDGIYRTWPRRLAEAGIDIAVVPLVDDEFNSCKSAIKFLELGYLEIPAIFSDVAAYRGTVENGVTGFLLGPEPAAWLDALEQLIADEALRLRIGENARRAVMAHHLLESHCGAWLEAYRRLL
jgi:glycosyltransferase involved in cell wall biosynthesis